MVQPTVNSEACGPRSDRSVPFGSQEGSPTVPRLWTRRNCQEHDPRGLKIVKWAGPMFFAGFGFYLQSVGLHYATYSYVHRMMNLTADERKSPTYATLRDPVEDFMGNAEKIDLGMIDSVAALFPMLFCIVAIIFRKQSLQIWTKVMICAGFLFMFKGLIGAVTTVPDSNGWETCKGRLKQPGMDWMTQTHSFPEFFTLDFQWVPVHHAPLRYCSDMMYSGHTFVVTLFALGSYELLRIMEGPLSEGLMDQVLRGKWNELEAIQTGPTILGHCLVRKGTLFKIIRPLGEKLFPEIESNPNFNFHLKRRILLFKAVSLTLLSVFAIGEQITEIYFVLKSHFHYTMDIIMALLVTFLFFTNGAIAIFSKQWELKGPGPFLSAIGLKLDCLPGPIKTFVQTHFIMVESEAKVWDDWKKEWRTKGVWVSRGDIFTPPCCVPCCCFAGRAHMYDDDGIVEIALASRMDNSPTIDHHQNDVDVKFLKGEMNLGEGVSLDEFRLFCNTDTKLSDKRINVKTKLYNGDPSLHPDDVDAYLKDKYSA